jgi:outer membrane protein assembly factor BamE (lipoprotein component of BamABCDE complex)
MSRKVLKKLVQTFIAFFILLLIFVSFAPSSIAGQNCFGIGTPKNVVLQIMGRPTDIIRSPYLNEETWYYGISSVTFKYGKVYEYWNFGNLKVWLGSIKKDAPSIKIGATKNSVLNAMGTPTAVSVFESLNEETWYYGISSITFQDNKVYEYDNFGNNLKVYAKTWTKSVSTINKSSTKSNEISFPFFAENGSYYGQISEITGRPKTVYVRGYYRKDGTYVRSYYRSKP